MYSKLLFVLFFYSHFVLGQNVIETKRFELSIEFKKTFENLKLYKDERFFPEQQEMSIILDSAKVDNRFMKYPDLDHGFPNDFSEQIDKGLLFLI
jgi:hypothetical protein